MKLVFLEEGKGGKGGKERFLLKNTFFQGIRLRLCRGPDPLILSLDNYLQHTHFNILTPALLQRTIVTNDNSQLLRSVRAPYCVL